MAPKRKLTPTEWVTMDVNGLAVEWKMTATGIVHFRWEGSAKQMLMLTKDEEAQDAPRRVRARLTPAAVVAAKASQAAREPTVGEPGGASILRCATSGSASILGCANARRWCLNCSCSCHGYI